MLKSNDRYLIFGKVSVVALLVLVANDHILKSWAGAGPWSLITGKLSDFSGAWLAPAWIEFFGHALLRIQRGVAQIIALIATAIGMSMVELSEHFARLYCILNDQVIAITHAMLGVPAHLTSKSHLTLDLTDLYALVILPLVAYNFRNLNRENGGHVA